MGDSVLLKWVCLESCTTQGSVRGRLTRKNVWRSTALEPARTWYGTVSDEASMFMTAWREEEMMAARKRQRKRQV